MNNLNKRAKLKVVVGILSLVLFILIIGFIILYIGEVGNSSQKFFFIVNESEEEDRTPIFNSDISDEYPKGMLFYPIMRFRTSNISYTIEDNCSETRVQNAREAFDILENETILNFIELSSGGQITVSCSKDIKHIDKYHFVAGEGGPNSIVNMSNRILINNGTILLYEDSPCSKPMVAIHEILHVIGFKHSSNEDSIMYNVSNCNQKITSEIVNTINDLYQEEPLADLYFSNIDATKHSNYLDINFTVSNKGLDKSGNTNVQIIGKDDKITTDYNIESLDVGEGLIITLKNIKIGYSTNEIRLVLDSFDKVKELNEENNVVVLEILE